MRNLYSAIIVLTLFSCRQETNTPVQFMVLGTSSVYDRDSVDFFLSHAPHDQTDSSKKLFLSGIDLLKNQKKALQSIESFLGSIRVYPNASAYYELGNAYLDDKKPEQALEAFKMAERLDYAPVSHVLFKIATCHAAMENHYEMCQYISFAVENGFVDKEKIFSNEYMLPYKNDKELIRQYNEAMSGNGDPEVIRWQGYSRSFPEAQFPLVIDSGSFNKIVKPVYISYDYEMYVPEMRDNRFSRDVGFEFFYFAKVQDTKDYKVLIYGSQSYEMDGAPVHFIMASFNKKGRLMDKIVLAGAKNFDEPFREALLQSNGSFEIRQYQNHWEKDVKEEGYDENRIISRDLVNSNQYIIDSTGRFMIRDTSSLTAFK
jgi:hypothetical protein